MTLIPLVMFCLDSRPVRHHLVNRLNFPYIRTDIYENFKLVKKLFFSIVSDLYYRNE